MPSSALGGKLPPYNLPTSSLTPSYNFAALLFLGIPKNFASIELITRLAQGEAGKHLLQAERVGGRERDRQTEWGSSSSSWLLASSDHYHRVSVVSIVFVARSTALVLIAFDVLLDFWPDSSFLFISIGLFIYFCLAFFFGSVCFTRCLCSALWRRVVRAGSSSFALWAWRKTCCNLVNLASANEIFIWQRQFSSLPPPLSSCLLPWAHPLMAWLTPIPKRLSLSLSVCRLKLCVKIVWLNNFGTCPARCTLIALHTSLLRQRRSRCRSWRSSRLGLRLGAASLHMAPHLVGHLRNLPRCLPH